MARTRGERWKETVEALGGTIPGEITYDLSEVDAVPANLRGGWDLAATPEIEGTDPDWTCRTKIGVDNRGTYYVLDSVRLRGTPNAKE